MFIASRNQVDADEFGAGYVNNWDQFRFAADLKAMAEKSVSMVITSSVVTMVARGSVIKNVKTIFRKPKRWRWRVALIR